MKTLWSSRRRYADLLCRRGDRRLVETLDHHVGGLDESGGGITLLQLQLPNRAGCDDCGYLGVPNCEDDLRQQSLNTNADHLAGELVSAAHTSITLTRLRRRLRL